ncbi:hypothetical protein [Actinoplanes solisilvae]|uniref:hypothetical protein n=1 Tax=Actinoplanes solisilvae TaxID=2486853 RepID=UPI000FDC0FB3|nr:hypothetical protein [Actinoplanes solisilvae]
MKLFRRDAGPGQSEAGLDVLRAELARLGADVGFEPDDTGRPFITVDADGLYHWTVVRDGEVLEDRTTTSRSEIVRWAAG